jgi:murein L,D-transpeptidase YcbB/YkuD
MKYWLSVVLTSLLFVACQKKNIPVTSQTSPTKDSIKEEPKEIVVQKPSKRLFTDTAGFQHLLESEGPKILIDGEKMELDSLTLNVYAANKNRPFWNDTSKCQHLIYLLEQSRFDGLKPSDYACPSLKYIYNSCYNKGFHYDSLFWKLELLVTQNYLKYLHHLRFGKTNPESIFKDWDYVRDSHIPHTPAELSELMAQHPDSLVAEFRPQYNMYKVLQGVLYKVDSIGHNTFYEWDPIPYIGKDLKRGDTSWVIVKIKQRLLSVGLGHQDSATTQFDDDLLASLSYFQQHVGITPNKKIDKVTIHKLNFTLTEIQDVVRVNMERCRWLPKGELPNHYIMVNIADFNLRIIKNDQEIYKTKVVVGKTNKETPLFHSKMSSIEFNPHWTAPRSISTGEILPILKKNSEYLSKNNMELLLGDSVVQITDFSKYNENNFPFSVRQKPGADNALGLVKFVFPNRYSVYFHDTPSKSYFERDERAFSHGCIRVYKPIDLATFILAGEGFTSKQVTDIVNSKENKVIGLRNRIPVIVTYWTCYSDKNDQVYFFKDIYGRDKVILKELEK